MKLQDLSIGHGRHMVQQHLTVEAEPGTFVGLIGRNGSGKSTLLYTLAGLLPPLAGDVLLADGQSLSRLTAADRARQIAIVLTERVGGEQTTVYDIVAMGRTPYLGWTSSLSATDREAIREAMEIAGVTAMADRYFTCLSDGERQRTLLAKALAQQTPYILLDEPTAHLDLPGRIEVMQLLGDLCHRMGKTIIISTHELELARRTTDRLWLMTPDGGIEAAPDKAALEKAFFR